MKKILILILTLFVFNASYAADVENKITSSLNNLISNGVEKITESLNGNEKIKYLDIVINFVTYQLIELTKLGSSRCNLIPD